jgi:D-alanine-D-alanine ligase
LRSALAACCDRLIQIEDLQEFSDRIGRFENSLVFPYWFGQQSRNRHGLVPAICEANKVMFIGADAFVKIVCNDKELSKAVCRQAGLSVPPSVLIRRPNQIKFARHLALPVVVKPNYEGSSLGMTQDNLCYSWDTAGRVLQELFEKLGGPFIIEEFVGGREFSACLRRTTASRVDIVVGYCVVDEQSTFLSDKLYTWDLKIPGRHSFSFEIATARFPASVLAAMKECFQRLGKVDLLRIDGRETTSDHVIFELSPDLYLGPDSEFAFSFTQDGTTYDELLSKTVRDCLERYGAN